MPTKPKRKSKGKQHPLHAESFEHMINDIKSVGISNYPIYRDDIVRMFRNELKRVRSILR